MKTPSESQMSIALKAAAAAVDKATNTANRCERLAAKITPNGKGYTAWEKANAAYEKAEMVAEAALNSIKMLAAAAV